MEKKYQNLGKNLLKLTSEIYDQPNDNFSSRKSEVEDMEERINIFKDIENTKEEVKKDTITKENELNDHPSEDGDKYIKIENQNKSDSRKVEENKILYDCNTNIKMKNELKENNINSDLNKKRIDELVENLQLDHTLEKKAEKSANKNSTSSKKKILMKPLIFKKTSKKTKISKKLPKYDSPTGSEIVNRRISALKSPIETTTNRISRSCSVNSTGI